MLTARRHLLIVVSTLALLLIGGFLFLITRGRGAPLDPVPAATTPAQSGRLTPSDAEVLAFFQQNPAKPVQGPGLFETDFFKPPPAPPKPPAPPPAAPVEKKIDVTYRGLAEFPSGARIAYLLVGEKLMQIAPGEVVVAPWKLASCDADSAQFTRDDTTLKVEFNKRIQLSVPAKN